MIHIVFTQRFKFFALSAMLVVAMPLARAATSKLEQRKERKPSSSGFNNVGAPKKITCSGTMLITKEAIKTKTDINKLLEVSDSVDLGTINPACGNAGTCEGVLKKDQLFMRYAFNSQGGNISIDDIASGQSTYQSWTNEYEVTKTGYAAASAWLTNTAGGLNANPKLFQVEFRCQALLTDR